MDLSWAASPYGLAIIIVLTGLAGFIASRGVYFDKDDKVLKIGSNKHPETLKQFHEIFKMVKDLKDTVEKLSSNIAEMKMIELKEIITNTQLPPNLRGEAYDEYIRRGGNSWVQAYFAREVKPILENQMNYRLHEGAKK
jgi:hypothetical protein